MHLIIDLTGKSACGFLGPHSPGGSFHSGGTFWGASLLKVVGWISSPWKNHSRNHRVAPVPARKAESWLCLFHSSSGVYAQWEVVVLVHTHQHEIVLYWCPARCSGEALRCTCARLIHSETPVNEPAHLCFLSWACGHTLPSLSPPLSCRLCAKTWWIWQSN